MAGGQKDVLVKLSAEGEEQVVAAFDKMAEAAKNRGKEAQSSMAAVNDAAKELGKSLAGLFAVGAVVEGFREMVSGAIETGETLSRLHAQTGISTDALQAYGYAAKAVGVDQEAMTAGMTRLARSIYQAQNGSKGAADALSAIGMSVKDFVGLTPDQQFDKVAKALGEMQDKTKAQAVAMALMGRGGAQLLPVFKEVAEQGLGAYIEKLKQLGIYQSPEMIDSFKHVAEQMKEIKAEAQGLATQFASGLAPAITAAMDSLVKATTGPGIDGFKTLGTFIGTVIKTIVLGLEAIGTTVGVTAGEIVADFSAAFTAIGDAWERVKNRDFSGAAGALGGVFGKFAENDRAAEQQLKDQMSANYDRLFKEQATKSEEKAPTGLGEADPNSSHAMQMAIAISKAKAQLTEQMLSNELAQYKAHSSLMEKEQKDAYDSGAESLAAYFAARRQIVTDSADKEIDVLRKKYAAQAAVLVDADNPAKALEKQTALAKLEGEIAAQKIQRDVQLAQLANEERSAAKANIDAQVKAQEALYTLQGKRIEQQRLSLEMHLKELETTLRADSSISAGDRNAALGTARTQGTAEIDYKQQADELKEKLKELQLAIAAIKQQVADGELFPVQGEQQILALEKERLPILQQTAAALQATAAKTGSAANVEQAQQATQAVNGYAVAINQSGQDLAKLKSIGEDTFTNGITNAITGVINGTKTAGQAFRQFGLQMAEAIEQAIVKMLVLKAVQAAAGFAGGGAVGGAPGHAAGGYVAGPGSNTSDSIPAMLSDGEFVVHAKAVQQPGMRSLLEAINGGGLRGKSGPAGVPQYAQGGMVSGSAMAHSTKIVNVLDPSLLGDHLATAKGETAVLNILSNNPNRVRESIG